MDYYRVHDVRAKIVRIFNTYGPRLASGDGRVVSNFIVQALQGKDITIYGDGMQTRSFCYVDDLITGMMAMMNHHDDCYIGPVNLGNPGEFTIFDLAEKVIKLTGTSSKILQQPLPQDDPRQRRPDITEAKKMLNWEPTVDLENGLIKTIDYFRKTL
jgi:UDP-glucuronate decarboxylase